MIILLHTSKTMRPTAKGGVVLQPPVLLDKAIELDGYLKKLSASKIASMMRISPKLAETTHELIAGWNNSVNQRVAIDSFLGDIYSGLQVHEWSREDREYANQHLRILSGLYGILKPLDSIYPYRFEMGYKLPTKKFKNMYEYWGDSIADTLPKGEPILNLAAVEYSKVVTDYVDTSRVIAPQFLTTSPKTGEPTFVVVHAKIARGAFARWMIMNQISDPDQLRDFTDLGYQYDASTSTSAVPVFICQSFDGIGLSVRLK